MQGLFCEVFFVSLEHNVALMRTSFLAFILYVAFVYTRAGAPLPPPAVPLIFGSAATIARVEHGAWVFSRFCFQLFFALLFSKTKRKNTFHLYCARSVPAVRCSRLCRDVGVHRRGVGGKGKSCWWTDTSTAGIFFFRVCCLYVARSLCILIGFLVAELTELLPVSRCILVCVAYVFCCRNQKNGRSLA